MLSSFMHGIRLGVGLAWFSLVAAEMMGASSGLGHGIQLFSLNLQIANLYAYLLTIGLVGFTLNLMLTWTVALGTRIPAGGSIERA